MGDIQNIVLWALGIAFSILGWVSRSLYEAIENLKKDISLLQVDLPKNYILKDDYRADMSEIKGMLKQIYEKLDGKADRSDLK